MSWRILALCAALSLGCGGDDGGDSPAADTGPEPSVDAGGQGAVDAQVTADAFVEPWVEIGTGDRHFEPLTADQVVPVIEGIQGGYHVWGAFRGGGFSGLEVAIDFEMKLGDEIIAEARYTEPALPEAEDGVFDYAAVAVIYRSNDDVGPTAGETMDLTLKVTSGDGTVLTDATTVVPDCCVLPTGMRADPP